MHEPQLVPALSLAPIAAALFAPAAMASQIDVRPTPKQAQITGPALTTPSAERPDSNMRRSSSDSSSAANSRFTTSQSPAPCAGPTNRQVSMRSPTKEAARKTPPPKSLYSATSPSAAARSQDGQRDRSAL